MRRRTDWGRTWGKNACLPGPAADRSVCAAGVVGVLLVALALPATARAEDLLGDLRTEAQAEIAAAARVEIKTATVSGDGLLRGRLVPKTTINLGTGVADYQIEYTCLRDDRGRRVEAGQPLSELGMPKPSAANWYSGGFLDVVLQGVGLVNVPATSEALALPAGRAGVRLTWPHPAGPVTARLITCSFDPFLYLLLELPAGTGRQIRLLCYPNAFAPPRDRWLTTSRRDLPHCDNLREDLAPDERDWVLYSDRAADPLRAPSNGPCGLVLLPEQAAGVGLEMGVAERPDWPPVQNYGVLTTITPAAEARRLGLALLDCAPTTWRQAQEQLRAEAPRVQTRLRELLAAE